MTIGKLAFSSLVALILSGHAVVAAGLEPARPFGGGWWVVVASPDAETYYAATANIADPYWRDVERARETAAECGLRS